MKNVRNQGKLTGIKLIENFPDVDPILLDSETVWDCLRALPNEQGKLAVQSAWPAWIKGRLSFHFREDFRTIGWRDLLFLFVAFIVTELVVAPIQKRYLTTIAVTATGIKASDSAEAAVAWLKSPPVSKLRNSEVHKSKGWQRQNDFWVSLRDHPAELVLRHYLHNKDERFEFFKTQYSGEVEIEINGTKRKLDLYQNDPGVESIPLRDYLLERDFSAIQSFSRFIVTTSQNFLLVAILFFLCLIYQRGSATVLPLTHLLAIFFLYGIFLCGTWTSFPGNGPALWVPFLCIGAFLSFFPEKYQENLYLRNLPSIFFTRIASLRLRELLLAVFIFLPSLLYLTFTWNQEFPFSGDHDTHLKNALSLSQFWINNVWILIGHAICGYWFLKSRYRTAWIFSGYLLALGLSFYNTEIVASYPGVDYFFTFPWMVLSRLFDWNSPLNALRLNHALSILFWLLVLRPVFFNRRPGPSILFLAVLFFYQKDIVYYFTSSYLEAWSCIFVLMGVEALFDRQKQALLWIGLASITKQQCILLLPFFGFTLLFIKETRSNIRSLLLTAAVSSMLFLFYLLARIGQSGLGLSFLSLEDLFSPVRINEFLKRLLLQWQIPGLIALGIGTLLIIGSWVSLRQTENNGRTWIFPFMISGAIFLVIFFYMNSASLFWTGYPRFQLISYGAAFALTIPIAQSLWDTHRARFLQCLALLFILNGIPLASAFLLTIRPSPYRNFMEHYEAPIFLSIRGLVEGMGAKNNLKDVRSLTVLNRIQPHPIEPLRTAYADLAHHYQIEINHRDDTQSCMCKRQDQAVLVPALLYVGLAANPADRQREATFLRNCHKELKKTCKTTYVQNYDGEVLGLGGVGLPP